MGLKPESEGEATPSTGPAALEPASGIRARLPLWDPPTDVLVTEEAVVVRVNLAGTTPNDIRVRAALGEVVVSGVRRDPLAPARRRIDRMEIAFGPDRAWARLSDGLLEINLPLSDGPADDSPFFDIHITMSV
jgi:HSP20 family molecular chaperone IbpA